MSTVQTIANKMNVLHSLSTNSIGASSPNSGFVNEPEFIFKEAAGFEYKTVIDEGYVKIGNKAYQITSSELAVNGDFGKGVTGWDAFDADISVEDGKLKVLSTGHNGRARQTITLPVGVYRFKATNSGTNPVQIKVDHWINADEGSDAYITVAAGQTLDTLFIASGNTETINLTDGTLGIGTVNYFSNVSITELTSVDFTGTLPDVGVIDGLGGETLNNGDFGSSTSWSFVSGWTISGGSAYSDGTGDAQLSQAVNLTADKVYRLTYQIASRDSGILEGYWGGSGWKELPSTVGKHVITLIASSNSNRFYFRPRNGNPYKGYIESVSLKEVTDNPEEVNASKGDYFIDDVELQDNYFSADTSNFVAVKSAILATDSGRLKITLGDTDGGAYRDIPTTIGENYVITYSGEIGTNSSYSIHTYDGAAFSYPNVKSADHSTTAEGLVLAFTANNSMTRVYALIRDSAGKIGYFPSISVKSSDNLTQATRDIADMYDQNLPNSGNVTVNTNEVVKYNGGANGGTIGSYYLRVGGSFTANLNTLDFTVTGAWQYLGSKTFEDYTDTHNANVSLGDGVILCLGGNPNGIVGHYYKRIDGYAGVVNPNSTSLHITSAYRDLGKAGFADYSDDVTSAPLASGKTVVKCTGVNATGVVGNYYKWVCGTTTSSNLTTTLLTDSCWEDLGSDYFKMSLDNPYFVDREAITNQVLAYIEEADDNTISTKTEVLMELSYAVETPIQVLTKNGFTHLGKGLFSKNGLNVIPIGIWQTKNEGAYHPAHNVMGTSGYVGGGNGTTSTSHWYNSNNTSLDSIVQAFTPYEYGLIDGYNFNTGDTGDSFRPENKSYDATYENDFIPMYNLASQTANTELSDRFFNEVIGNKLSGVSNMVATRETIQTGGSGSTYPNVEIAAALPKPLVGSDIWHNGEAHKIESVNTVGSEWRINLKTIPTKVDGASISYVYELPILSRGTQTRLDIIGSPANYPQDWKDELTRGKSLLFNPLLVGQDGTDYTNVTNKDIIASKKIYSLPTGRTYSDSMGATWSYTETNGSDLISNVIWSSANTSTGRIALMGYIAVNGMVLQSDPKIVTTVNSKVVASNLHTSHIVNACLGKVATGNLANGLESKMLDNALIGANVNIDGVTVVTVRTNDVVELSFNAPNGGKLGEYFLRIGTDDTRNFNTTNFYDTQYWKQLNGVFLSTIPRHGRFTLNKAVSPTCKYFVTIAEQDGYKYGMVYAKEMIWDYAADNVGDAKFNTVASTITAIDWTKDSLYRIASDFGDLALRCVNPISSHRFSWLTPSIDGKSYLDNDGTVILEKWDGTGFGDNGEFNQLTNGTDTDLNGNTITTFVGAFRLNELGA